ncbi:MAG: glycosyltransferase family 39 protein [Chloroflexi bacterium]|nr:glycosyltransferase family 39 protein [Chloroflexota bacterium]
MPAFPGLRYVAALILLAFLPGWVWLQALFAPSPPNDEPKTPTLLDLLERLTLAIGLSLALTIVGTMFAVYLPGTFTLLQLLITINVLILTGLVVIWWQQRFTLYALRFTLHALRFTPNTLPIITLLVLLLLAATLRLPRLGYAEFHEDEAEALMLGVRLMQGEDYALFLHRKGPAQMLIPLAFWLLTGQITEAMARFPFALSSILSVATLFFIGRRWFNGQTGAIAALLWAINGYGVAFGRMAQYQALIFFLGPLGLYCLYLAGLESWKGGRWLILGAILLATCLLAHFDALLLLPTAAYLGWVAVSRGAGEQGGRGAGERGRKLFPTAPLPTVATMAVILFLALLASFYIPYLLDPEFKNTANYLAEARVRPGWLYNNLGLLRRLDKAYSSRFYLPLLGVGLIGFMVWPGIKKLAGSGAMHLQSASHLRFGVEAKAAWLMFGAGFIGYVFLVDDPRTHLYIMYPGAALLAGAGWAAFDLRFTIYDLRFTLPRLLAAFLFVASVGLVIAYEGLIFLSTESALDGLHQKWDISGWEVVYDDLPQAREYFGYPKREGWKAIGALRAQGLFPGDFRSVNEDFIIPIWYNFGQARSCYDTPAQFFVRAPGIDFYIPAPQIEDYGEVGWIQREGEVRLRVFSALNLLGSSKASGKIAAPPIYTLEALTPAFDQLATPQRFMQQAEPSRLVITQFGPAIQFLGFDLPSATVAPGETLYVNLYWRALQNPGENYRVFVHLTDRTNLWGQQDEDPACPLPASIWRPGQHGLGQFRLPIKPETPPGRYPLIIGLYRADTLERLKITGGAGQVGDDFLWLGDVEVVE